MMPPVASTPLALPLGESALTACELCPRRCRVDRVHDKRGYCGSALLPRVFRWGPHFGEEPPLSGTRGSGAIFFSHCTLRCIYCQNGKWSNGGLGEDLTVEALRERFRVLYDKGCHNWNLVSPTPWLPQIAEAVKPLLEADIRLPFVYNTSSFERPESLSAYQGLIDIALADLRYASAQSAWEGSAQRDYVPVARKAIRWFWDHLGPLTCDGEGIARRGLIVRLLALPGRTEEVADNLVWLRNTLGPEVAISVMAQYNPVGQARVTPGWDRRLSPEEFAPIAELVDDLGFENGWVQPCEETTAECMLGDDMQAGYGEVR